MRSPLIGLLICNAIAILGLSLMPGVEVNGQETRLTLSEAFYVISYTETTIGFGELPSPFSSSQRLWMIFSILITVTSWFYTIGKIISLLQDPVLKKVIQEARFRRAVQNIDDRFFIIIGYEEAGQLLVESLVQDGVQVVILDNDEQRLSTADLLDATTDIPNLLIHDFTPEVLKMAGLNHKLCAGLVTMFTDDDLNANICMSARLLNPEVRLISRAETMRGVKRLELAGVPSVLNSYHLFGQILTLILHSVEKYRLKEWVTGMRSILCDRSEIKQGTWIVCGFGRFGKSVVEHFKANGTQVVIIEADPNRTDCDFCIVGSGAEEEVLTEAGIHNAVGIIAGTDQDIINLSIITTAKAMNPNLFTVTRQNRQENQEIFKNIKPDINIHLSDIVATRCFAFMKNPILPYFFKEIERSTTKETLAMIQKIEAVMGDIKTVIPQVWSVELMPHSCKSWNTMKNSSPILNDLVQDPFEHGLPIRAVPLMLIRGQDIKLFPDLSMKLVQGDHLLFCGTYMARRLQGNVKNHPSLWRYVQTGSLPSEGYIFQWIDKKLNKNTTKKV